MIVLFKKFRKTAAHTIREDRGSRFDPFLVDVFERVGDGFALISNQQTS